MVYQKLIRPKTMRSPLAVLVIAFVLATVASAQSASDRRLTLTGSLISVRPVIDYSPKDKGMTVFEKNLVAFDVELYLQFKNESATSIILIPPAAFGGSLLKKKLVLLDDVSARSGTEESSAALRWKDRYIRPYDRLSYLLRELDTPEPSRRFVIIEPGAYYECHDTLTVRNGYFIKLKAGQDPENSLAVSEFPRLSVEYHLSLNDLGQHSDALATAQRNWKKFGELLLDSNGDYTVKSEIILNKLPE
jgi:hypothetical protein